jgi:Fe-S oxidoreductase
VAARCFLFEQFIDDLLEREPKALIFNENPARMMIHAHCHTKALVNTDYMYQLATRMPQRDVTMLEAGCCGMAGAFGMLESKYKLSLKVAEPIIQVFRNQPFGTIYVASGTSCRQQIRHLALVRVQHMAEVIADALI